MKEIAIYGAGGLGREIQMLIEQINVANPRWSFVGFFDDGHGREAVVNGAPVLGGVNELNARRSELALVLAFGKPEQKRIIRQRITNGKIHYPVLIHPSAQVADRRWVRIGEGSILTAGTIVAVNVQIGAHVLINFGSIVGHDARIGDYSSIMPSVNVNGEAVIQDGVYLGVRSAVINRVEVGRNSVIGAGSIVFNSIRENCTAMGVPAVPVRDNKVGVS